MGTDLEREFKALSSRLPFGLNFERHRPEVVELPGRPVRRGDKVRVLPDRGSTAKGDPQLWVVRSIGKADKTAILEPLDPKRGVARSTALADLVVVAEFRDTLYPGLVSTGKVMRGGDKPFHTVINGENYHVLKALTFTHRGCVDAIYIDPPYNTGAKDWKYNNDFVEADDIYRHSKWLAMMERRLLVAKELLNPAESVLIVTIDEKEYLRLGLLLEQVIPEARIQMVSSVINPASSARKGEFGRSNEYVFLAYFGNASPSPLVLDPDWFGKTSGKRKDRIRWQELSRRGDNGRRIARPNLFYPIFVLEDGSAVHSVGDEIPKDADLASVVAPAGTLAIWPIRQDGSHGTWGRSAPSLRSCLVRGFIRLGGFTPRGMAVYHLAAGEQRKVLNGTYPAIGNRPDGSVIVDDSGYQTALVPGTQWDIPSHDASSFGSALLARLLPGRRFPFPKSLYAVEDVLRFFVMNKTDAIVLDFFSGSGTTGQAVMRLNKQDGGRRRCICVTNNEVAAEEQKALLEKGLRPGDPEWEQWGICDYITKPRIAASITGMTPEGDPIKGDYKFTDEFSMAQGFEENAEFFTLTYESPVNVRHSEEKAFARIAPLLWLRAGSRGRRIDRRPDEGWAVVESYGLLDDVDAATPFIKAVKNAEGLRMAFIVTDDDRRFQAIARRLPEDVEAVRLYEAYLNNFSFANGDDA